MFGVSGIRQKDGGQAVVPETRSGQVTLACGEHDLTQREGARRHSNCRGPNEESVPSGRSPAEGGRDLTA